MKTPLRHVSLIPHLAASLLAFAVADIGDIAEPHGRIMFAGEHTHTIYHATVLGAYLSGIRAAEDALRVQGQPAVA